MNTDNSQNHHTPNKGEVIRTYFKDLEQIDQEKSPGIFNQVVQEKKLELKQKQQRAKQKRNNIIFFIISVILTLVAIVFLVAIPALTKPPSVETGPKVPGFFEPDYNVLLDTSNPETLEEEMVKLAGQNFLSPSVVRIVPAQNGKLVLLPSFFKLAWPNLPLLLNSAVSEEFMYGFYTQKNETAPFLLLKIKNLNNAVQGMLFWEANLYQDLLAGFGLETFDNPADFRDEVIMNRDVRSLYRSTTIEQTETIEIPVILVPTRSLQSQPTDIVEPEKTDEITTSTESNNDTISNLEEMAVPSENLDFTSTNTQETAQTNIEPPTSDTPPSTINENEAQPEPEPEPVIEYRSETIVTTVPGPEKRILFYTIINGEFILVTTTPETVREIVNRLAW